MLIREIGPFRLLDDGFWAMSRRAAWSGCGGFDLCDSDLGYWFDIDENKLLYVRIHDRASKNRLTVTGHDGGDLHVICSDGSSVFVDTLKAWVLRLRIPYPYYVEIVQ